MLRPRIIPCLLLDNQRLVKTVGFREPGYVGDPVNALNIFNNKEVDEVIVLDISRERRGAPDFGYIAKLTSECFMPLCYGGFVSNLDQIGELFRLGLEKVSLNTALLENPDLVCAAADRFGSQSIVASIDVVLENGHYLTWCRARQRGLEPALDTALRAQKLGAGEIMLNNVDRDGTMVGYDLDLARSVCQAVSIPVILCGGAGSLDDFHKGLEAGASACAAGSFFVYKGKHRAVLISYPRREQLARL